MLRYVCITASLSLSLLQSLSTSRASELTAENIVMSQGTTSQIIVRWTSTTSLTYLNTQFQILPAAGQSGGPSAGLKFAVTSGQPPVPPMTDTNYVFYGDSTQLSLYESTSINPATVTTTSWANDTYNFLDETITGDPAPQTGTRLWTVLNVQAGALVTGAYYLALTSAEYNTPALIPTFNGGLITVVPEPSVFTLSAIATFAVLLRAVRCRDRRSHRHQNGKIAVSPPRQAPDAYA